MDTNNNSKQTIEFASQDSVNVHSALLDDFIHRVLELEGAWISDESCLWDFHMGKSDDELLSKIQQVYGVDVSEVPNGNIARILERIAAVKQPKT